MKQAKSESYCSCSCLGWLAVKPLLYPLTNNCSTGDCRARLRFSCPLFRTTVCNGGGDATNNWQGKKNWLNGRIENINLLKVTKMSSVQSFKIYEILKKHFQNEADAKELVHQIEAVVENRIDQKKDIFLTKDDKVDLIKWMVGFWIAQMAAISGLYIKK